MAVYAITRHGLAVAERVVAAIPGAELLVSTRLDELAPASARRFSLPMPPVLSATFPAYDAHVFVISVGAVVRMIAPLLEDKKKDPAVLCLDEKGRFVICVLSGHVGRGNAFSERLAEALGAIPVVTTASDTLGTLTVDILGRELGWTLDDPDRNVTAGCAAVVNEARVAFVHEAGEPHFWPLDRKLPASIRYVRSLEGIDPREYEVLLVASDRELPAELVERAVIYRPRTLVVGLGCDRGTPPELVRRGAERYLREAGLARASVRALASVDLKADEPALLELAATWGVPLETFPAAALDGVAGVENPSATVLRHVGTRGVAEPAALLAAGATRLLVGKRIYSEPGAGRSMTFAVARVPHGHREIDT
jgi:cobalt-precorrin 5A hydrolase